MSPIKKTDIRIIH